MTLTLPLVSAAVLAVVYTLYRRLTNISIRGVPGPEPESFLLGNLGELFQGQASEADFKWQDAYGDIVRIKAPFGEDRLLISDPKALQYIFQTSGYNFTKQIERRELSRWISGRGILWADGDDHKRHRKVMLPGFGGPEAKALVPLFSAYASQLATQWKDLIAATTDQSIVANIPHWASRATLDAIGEAAFDYKFGAMENADNALGKAYTNLFSDTFGSLSKAEIFVQNALQFVPSAIIAITGDYLPSNKLGHVRQTAVLATNVAKSLVTSKSHALLQGKGNKDIMSLLVKSNVSQNATTQLTEEEILAQMRTIIMAGHETTANTLSWTLLELSRRPDIQTKLRAEIRATDQIVQARGDSEFTSADFDGMPYLTAVLKESLRFHPVAYNAFRQAAKDDVLPLSKPITLNTGEVISELPIPKGLKIVSSIGGYNRNKDIFGQDAHTFNPERWLNPTGVKKATSVGVYGNLLSFAGGVRSCIGWKFALQELQSFLVILIDNFEFSLTPDAQKIRREACLVMVPTIEGQVEKGAQMPLRIRVASREDF